MDEKPGTRIEFDAAARPPGLTPEAMRERTLHITREWLEGIALEGRAVQAEDVLAFAEGYTSSAYGTWRAQTFAIGELTPEGRAHDGFAARLLAGLDETVERHVGEPGDNGYVVVAVRGRARHAYERIFEALRGAV